MSMWCNAVRFCSGDDILGLASASGRGGQVLHWDKLLVVNTLLPTAHRNCIASPPVFIQNATDKGPGSCRISSKSNSATASISARHPRRRPQSATSSQIHPAVPASRHCSCGGPPDYRLPDSRDSIFLTAISPGPTRLFAWVVGSPEASSKVDSGLGGSSSHLETSATADWRDTLEQGRANPRSDPPCIHNPTRPLSTRHSYLRSDTLLPASMSLDVAIQSVAFYVLSCSTCAKISHRRKAKQQARRERAEKHALETEQPGLYRHPSPFSTNPYWTEEIMMGPGPPTKKGGSKNGSQRVLNTARPGSSYAGSTAMSSETPSTTTAVTESSRLSGEGWNRRRYQREDEALWGHDIPGPGQKIMDAIAKAGSSAGRLLEGRLNKSGLREEESPSPYSLARNPPVNDLHPPVVSTAPASKDETRWMLQPPPPAKVMEGKERVDRKRAGSNGSSRRGNDGLPLGRQVTERLVDAKLQRGELPYAEARARTESKCKPHTQKQPRDQPLGGDRSVSLESPGASDVAMKRSKKPSPIFVPSSERSSRDMIEHIPLPSKPSQVSGTEMREQPSRPALTIILSSSNMSQQAKQEDDVPLFRELSGASDSAINVPAPSPSPSQRLSPSANAMPVTLPPVQAKPPSAPPSSVPARFDDAEPENQVPAN
ncbi:hypothetical protein JHW43_002225 [Diplocarpon mali]|nr:hypothetical protein JHW43_002225 [Diplocarpon mali]